VRRSRVPLRITGRTLVLFGVVALLGAAGAAALAITGESGVSLIWAALSGGLVCLAAVALGKAPMVEAALLVEQARKLIEAERFQDALPGLNRAIELCPRLANAYIARSAAYAGISQIDLAAEDADRAVKVAPELPESRLVRARLSSYRGLHEDAIYDLRAGIRIKPDWATGYLELAQLHIKLEDYDSSLATLRDLDLHASSDDIRYDSIIYTGWVYEEKLNDLDRAIAAYTRAIPIMPDRKVGYLRRAYAYRTRGDLYQSAEDLFRAAQRPPTPEDAGQYNWLRAVCYGRRYTITGEDRDLLAWLSALERSVREDAPTFSQQSRNWLKALRERQDDAMHDEMSSPPHPHIFPN
jgi:tetratricopeptide (TPR) repeat protein